MCHSSLDSLRGKEGDDNGYAVYTKVLENKKSTSTKTNRIKDSADLEP